MTKCNVCHSEFSVVLCSLDMCPAWYYLKCMKCDAYGEGSRKREYAEASVLRKKVNYD